MVPKMLLHVESVLNYLEDPDYRNELSNAIGKYISANIDAVCEEVTQLMVLDNVISENIITEIVRLKPSHAGQILSDWCMKSEKNIIFIFDNKDGFNLRSIFPDTELFQSFVKVLMSKVDALGMDGMKQIVDLQNSYYTRAVQKQQADKMSSPKRDEEEVKKSKIDLSIDKQEGCCATTKEQESKLKNSTERVNQLTSEIRKNKSNQKPDKHDDRSLEEEPGAVPKELLELARLKPQRHQRHKFFSDIFLRSHVWQTYSFTEISDLSQNVAISCYTFMDLIIEWLRTHQTPEKKFKILLGKVNIERLSGTFLLDLKKHLKSNYGFNLSKLLPLLNFEAIEESEVLSWKVTVNEFKKLTSRQVIHLSTSKCPVVGCQVPSKVKFYVLLQLCNEYPAVLTQDKVDQSQIALNSGHLHPDNVVHWYAVINDTNRIISLNLTPVDKLKHKLAGASNVTVKCVISNRVALSSIALEDSNNNYDDNLTKLHEIKALTYVPYQLSQSIEDLLRTKFIGISPYQYIELCTQWIESRKPEKYLFDVIWSSFPTDKVSKEFIGCIRSKLTSLNYTIYYPEISVPISISTVKVKFDFDLEDPFCYSCEETSDPIELTFKNEENYEYTVTVCFFSSAPLVRVQRVTMKPRIVSSFIKVCHIYFQTVSNSGNSSFVSILSNDEDEFEDALTSRRRCYIYFDYYMPARVTM